MSKKTFLGVLAILGIALFLRTFRSFDLLRFYYDQGRDAIIVNRMIRNHQPVLVGPTTGLAGILRGPAFYYLLIPGYLLGRGDPSIAAIWLQFINLIGLVILYVFTLRVFNLKTAILTLIFVATSFHFVSLSRWLSNPSAIFISVPIMLFSLHKIQKGLQTHLYYPILFLMLGLNLQFEIASEIWFIPIILVLIVTRIIPRPSTKTALVAILIFFVTLLPQIIFDLRHDGIMRSGIIQHFASGESSFGYDHVLFLKRLETYLISFTDLVSEEIYFVGLVACLLVFVPPFIIKKSLSRSQYPYFYLLLIPIIILLFYTGNNGNFYKYYLIGLTPLFAIFLANSIVSNWNNLSLRFLSLMIIFFFIIKNSYLFYGFFTNDLKGDNHISLGNQMQTIEWLYQDSAHRPFNLDIYVPPVTPFAYQYLLEWYQDKHQITPKKSNELFYSLSEIDENNPDKLKSWISSHNGYGKIKKRVQFGGITLISRFKDDDSQD